MGNWTLSMDLVADAFCGDDAGQKSSNADSAGEEEETIVDDGEKNSVFP